MQYKGIICLILIVITNISGLGQLNGAYSTQQLNIGDNVPDILMTDIINYEKDQIFLSNFKGRMLILYFWSISCVGCIKALPKYVELQKKFEKEIFILPIALGFPKKTVLDFLERSEKNGCMISLPSAIYENFTNNVFTKMFPVIKEGVPVIVWIDRQGKLRAITNSGLLTEEIITKMINNDSIKLPVKVPTQKNFDYYKPFLINNNGGHDSAFIFRSIVSPYSDSVGTGKFIIHRTKKFLRLFATNRTIIQLFQDCLYRGRNEDVFNKRLVLEVKDSSKFQIFRGDVNRKNKMFCYELILPPNFSEEEAFAIMKDDLSRFFKVSAAIEAREVFCLVIRNLNYNLITKKKESIYEVTSDKLGLKITNKSIKYLFSHLSQANYPLIIDETTYSDNIDISINIPERYDFNEVNRLLYKFGLESKEAKRKLDVVVIKDIGGE